MVLKMFSKTPGFDSNANEHEAPSNQQQQRIEKLEGHLTELGGEVVKLRQEVNTLLARQHTFKMALRRLREYLEDRGSSQEEVVEEVGASFQDLAHEGEEEVMHESEGREVLVRAKSQTKLH